MKPMCEISSYVRGAPLCCNVPTWIGATRRGTKRSFCAECMPKAEAAAPRGLTWQSMPPPYGELLEAAREALAFADSIGAYDNGPMIRLRQWVRVVEAAQ